MNRHADAQEKREEAMERSPNDPSYPARLGALLASQNKLEEAARYFEKALRLNPKDFITRRNLAACYWQLGKLPEARKNFFLSSTLFAAQPERGWSGVASTG